MARLEKKKNTTGKFILVVDDKEDYAFTTASLIEREGHTVVTALNGEDAIGLVQKQHFDVMLLDYYMPGGMTGEEVVQQIRAFNPFIQIILQTGYSGEYPPREMLKRLDIQGYHDKSDGPDKLLIWIDVGLKSAFMVNMLNKSRQGLHYILDITPDLHKMQPLEELLQGILLQISGLLGIVNSFLAIVPANTGADTGKMFSEGFVAIIEEETNLVIRAKTGRFTEKPYSIQLKINTGCDIEIELIQNVLENKKIEVKKDVTIIPLTIGEFVLGVIYLEQSIRTEQDIELLQIFANQAAVAIQNARLYEMATIDPLSRVYARGFFIQCTIRELRNAFRIRKSISFMLLDMDGLKKINDTAGHLAGDQALQIAGRILRQATRNTDFVGRFGGDEFAIILPQTAQTGTEIVGKRIFELLADKTVEGTDGKIPIRLSIGACEVPVFAGDLKNLPRPISQEYFEVMAKQLIEKSDEMLYQVKREGGGKISFNRPVEWPEFL